MEIKKSDFQTSQIPELTKEILDIHILGPLKYYK